MIRNRSHMRAILCMLLTVLCVGCITDRVARHPDDLQIEPLSFSPPRAERMVLSNGMVAYLLEDHALPLFDVVAYCRAGSIYEPADKIGLAGLTGTVMRTGGTTSITGDEIDEALEFMAASVEVEVDREAAMVTLSALAKDMTRGLELFTDILRNPVFHDDKLDLAKKRAIEDIRRRYDTPGSIIEAEFPKLIYGEDSVWARLPTEKTIGEISREDLVRFHETYFVPNNMILGISGDFDTGDLTARLETLLGDWPPNVVSFPPIPPLEPVPAPSVNYIHKQMNQSNIRLGHLGVRRHDPHEFAIEIMNYVLGWGGFTSRLWKEVRSDRGLAYHVYGVMGSGMQRGIFEAGCQTSAQTTCEAIAVIRAVIAGMREAPPTADELALAKESKLNRFVFNFGSSAQIVRQRAALEFYGYPSDYLDTYEANIRAVTREDVHRVANEHLHPEKLVTLVVGDAGKFDQPLSAFGDVETLELPGPAGPAGAM
jgi:zinc protease